jgi:hypothetical protein
MTVEVPVHADQIAFNAFMAGLVGMTVPAAQDAWDLAQDGSLTLLDGDTTIDPDDPDYAAWTLCRWVAVDPILSACVGLPDGGLDVIVTAIAPGADCHRAPHTAGRVAVPLSGDGARLYHSDHLAGAGTTTESDNAPDLEPEDNDEDWSAANTANYVMLYPEPAGSVDGGGSGSDWSAVNASSAALVVTGFMVRLGYAGLVAIIQSGGSASMQMRCRSRSGIGINEANQDHYTKWSGRIYRPGTGFVAQLWTVASFTGSVKFPAQSTPDNRSWSATRAAYAEADADDYLVIDVGIQHNGPESGGTGVGIFSNDSAGSDLPAGDGPTDNLRSWLELCG